MDAIQQEHFAFGLISQKQKRTHFCFNYCFKSKDEISAELTDNNYDCLSIIFCYLESCVKKYEASLKLMRN